MDVQELIARFPEIPEVLHEKPVLKRYAEVFGDLCVPRGSHLPARQANKRPQT